MKKMKMSGSTTSHEELMHGVKPGMKKMKKGGPTSMDRKKMGRNMSRVKNQRSK
jgi:hypothetical protein